MRFVELKKRLAARNNLPLLLVFLVLLAGCSGDRESSTAYEGFEARKHPTPRVILITVDTLRADALSSYHPQGGPTPSVDRLAEDGVLFNHVMAVAPWTLPSLASLLTGVAPNVHGAVGRESVVPNDLPTLAEYMRDAGYLTAGLGSNVPARDYRGFLRYDMGGSEFESIGGDLQPHQTRPRLNLLTGIIMLPCADGTHASSIRTDRATPAGAARQRQPFEPAGAQRHLVCRRAWLQMARVTRTVWQLAHPLHPRIAGRRTARPGLRALAARTDRACQARRCRWIVQVHPDGDKKNGPQAIPIHHQDSYGCRG